MSLSDLDVAAHLSYALQLSLGIVFMFAAVPKLRHPTTFRRTIAAYRVLPRDLVPSFATLAIAIESFLALAFLTGWMVPIALSLAALILALFSVAVGINLRRGRRIPCGCFGGQNEDISSRSLSRLSMLLGAVLLLTLMRRSAVTVDTLVGEGVSALAYLVQAGGVAGFLILAGAWLLSLPELLFILRVRVQAKHGTHAEGSG